MVIDCEALLRKHNPRLVILPMPVDDDRGRPHGPRRGKGRGDYHPCSAELFLRLVTRYDKRRPFEWSALKPWTWPALRIWKWPVFQPWTWSYLKGRLPPAIEPALSDLEPLRKLVGELEPGASAPWELDLAPVSSLDPDQAWQVYRGLLKSVPESRKEVVYGRCFETPLRVVLQYWYLYVYNDSVNRHEGDWEMASIELDRQTLEPLQVGYAGHGGGARRSWKRLNPPGDQPYVYVARGSHAAYLDYMPKGHRTVSLEFPKNFPILGPILSWLAHVLSRGIFGLGVKDHTPGLPGSGAREEGEVITPELIVLPGGSDFRDDPRWWWLDLDCPWGSSRSRFFAVIGPSPPWMKGYWVRPISWIRRLKER